MPSTPIAIILEAQTDGEYCGAECEGVVGWFSGMKTCRATEAIKTLSLGRQVSTAALIEQNGNLIRCQACLDGETLAKEMEK